MHTAIEKSLVYYYKVLHTCTVVDNKLLYTDFFLSNF